ncbi:acetate--CoA ligase family protein [Halogeometricum luteum]|uniref:acetate--CoA ligase (ADP-forming) n=1 Tax=Halogeometricum luteum TaxID=2950537 RepID=A0ABU2G4J8_9EURY|nr:acetate--CoA ligase family protein [Halogeometricum sp. S3BR5-2]MDS0295717.1 acetate--CoA ligase family protein [Halogeometricum sp. S3BR5-2]
MSEDPIARARTDGRTTLTEAEAKTVLTEWGVDTPAFEVVSTPGAAADAAEEIGFPAVLKVSSPAVVHKSEWMDGLGVTVGVTDADEAADVAADILGRADDAGIEAQVLVEAAAETASGTEVIVGGIRDPSFGPVVLAGLGGVFTELFEDTAHRLAPITDAEARAALRELRSAPLLEGYRGSAPADIDGLATVLRTVGDLLAERTEIAEIDVNPVLASVDGALALDAVITLRDE